MGKGKTRRTSCEKGRIHAGEKGWRSFRTHTPFKDGAKRRFVRFEVLDGRVGGLPLGRPFLGSRIVVVLQRLLLGSGRGSFLAVPVTLQD